MSNAQKPIFMKKKRSTRTIPASSLSLQLAMQKQQRQQQSAAAMSPPISGAKMTQMTAQTVIHCQLQLNARREKRGWGKGNSFYDVLASKGTNNNNNPKKDNIALHCIPDNLMRGTAGTAVPFEAVPVVRGANGRLPHLYKLFE